MKSLAELGELDRGVRAGEFSAFVRCWATARGVPHKALSIAEKTRAPRRTVDVLKAAVAGGGPSDPSWGAAFVDWRTLSSAFVDSLRSTSAFAQIYPSMTKVPLGSRVNVATAPMSAAAVTTPGAGLPLRALSLSSVDVPPLKAGAIAAVSNELLESSPAQAEALISNALRQSVGLALDTQLVTTATAGASSSAATAAVFADLRTLLAVVATSGSERLFWLAHPTTARRLATLTVTGGAAAFPGANPLGGELLGAQLVVTSALSTNELVLLDATSLVASLEETTIDISDAADLQMVDSSVTVHSLTPTASTMVSMFQTDSTAIRVVVRFGVARIRTGGVAKLTGSNW